MAQPCTPARAAETACAEPDVVVRLSDLPEAVIGARILGRCAPAHSRCSTNNQWNWRINCPAVPTIVPLRLRQPEQQTYPAKAPRDRNRRLCLISPALRSRCGAGLPLVCKTFRRALAVKHDSAAWGCVDPARARPCTFGCAAINWASFSTWLTERSVAVRTLRLE